MYKYGLGVDLESDVFTLVDLADLENRLITPIDLIYGTNKRVLYWFKDKNIGIPVVDVKVEDRAATIYWGLPEGQQIPDGWDIYFKFAPTDKIYRLPVKPEESNLSVNLEKGCYSANVVAQGNSSFLINSEQQEWFDFCIK